MKNRDLIIEQNHTLMARNIMIPLSNIHISEGTMHTFMRQWTVQGINTFPPKNDSAKDDPSKHKPGTSWGELHQNA